MVNLYKLVREEQHREGGRGWLTLDRPAARNALSEPLRRALRTGLVNEVLPHDELIPRVREVAARIGSARRGAVRTTLDRFKAGSAGE